MHTVAITGNPNSGKSSVFNQLTGLRQKVANFPGVTVEKKIGKLSLPGGREITLIDFPGTYSLYPNSEDERVLLQVLSNPSGKDYPDLVVYIADITNLEKHLLLLSQIADLQIPCILVLNMTDLAEGEGLQVNTEVLEQAFGIPVVKVSGRKGYQIGQLSGLIAKMLDRQTPAKPFYQPDKAEKSIAQKVTLALGIENVYRALLIAHHYQTLPFLSEEQRASIRQICEEGKFPSLRMQIEETMTRFQGLQKILRDALQRKNRRKTLTDRLDQVLTHSFFAPLIFFAIMFFVFQAIYAWAEVPMNWMEAGFGALGSFLQEGLPPGWFTDLLTEGVVTGLGGILVFIPQIAILFFLVTLLEEVGYMARAVYIFDKFMQQFGLNGRSVVALISGGACAIPAIMSTRTISNWKERLITIMVTPLISCSARIPVYTVLIGFVVPKNKVWGMFNLQGLAFMGLYLLGIVAALASANIFRLVLRSRHVSWLMMELPPYRMPHWPNVWLTIKDKVGAFVWEAGKVILVISIVLWALASYGPAGAMQQAEQAAQQQARQLSFDQKATDDLVAAYRIEASFAGHLGKFIEPAIAPLGFDWKIGIALITSFAAREVFVATMATIYSIGSAADDEATIHDRMSGAVHADTGLKVYTPATSLSLLIFYVFAMQCMSTLAVVRRETGSWKWPLIQFFYMGFLAYAGSFLIYQLLS